MALELIACCKAAPLLITHRIRDTEPSVLTFVLGRSAPVSPRRSALPYHPLFVTTIAVYAIAQ